MLKRPNMIIGGLITIVSLIGYYYTCGFVEEGRGIRLGDIGPGYWPKKILLTLALLGLLLAIFDYVSMQKEAKPSVKTDKNGKNTSSKSNPGLSPVISMACFLGYILIMPVLGFMISSTLLILVMSFLCGYKKFAVSIPISLVFSISMTWLFVKMLAIPLPKGIGPF